MLDESKRGKLLWASFLTLIAAGMGFSVRGGILGSWSASYGFTQSELGTITGGGLVENIPRVLPAGLAARIDLGSWQVAPVFDWLQQTGKVEQSEMLRTFNCGVGMILAIDSELEQPILQKLQSLGEQAWVIGDVIEAPDQAAVIFE